MQKEVAANDPVNAANTASATESINQIREILFGNDRRTLEQRLDVLEHRLRQSEQALRDDFDTTVQALRTQVAHQAEQLLETLATERAARTRFAEDIVLQITNANETLTQRLNQLDSALTDDLKQTRHQMEQQLQDLANRVTAEQATIARQIEETNRRLRADTVDATRLSQLFDELAAQLRGRSTAKSPA